jgi:hypothetical protein
MKFLLLIELIVAPIVEIMNRLTPSGDTGQCATAPSASASICSQLPTGGVSDSIDLAPLATLHFAEAPAGATPAKLTPH